MKIITSYYTFTQQKKISTNQTHNKKYADISIGYINPPNSIHFLAKKIPRDKLTIMDKYIERLKAIKKIKIEADKELGILLNKQSKELDAYNNKHLKPLLKDNNFLWEIISDKQKEKYSAFIVKSSYHSPNGKQEENIFDDIYKMIRINILNESSKGDDFIDETTLKNPKYKIKLLKLKKIIYQKQELIQKHKDEISDIYSNMGQKILDLKMEHSSLSSPKDYRELASRSIQKYPTLKKLQKEMYKYWYNSLTHIIKQGKRKREASDFANRQVLNFLESSAPNEEAYYFAIKNKNNQYDLSF